MSESDNFNKWLKSFTPRARHVLVLAQKEARNLNHDAIRPEHLLLGIAALGEGVAVEVMKSMGVKLENLRREVERNFPPAGTTQQDGNTPFSQELTQIFVYAAEEARGMNYNYIGTEHLLLALLRDPASRIARILKGMDIDSDHFRKEVIKALDPSLDPTIGKISAAHLQGKHTTSLYEMYPLTDGGFIIDSPGLRGFGLVDLEKEEIALYFPEMLAAAKDCRFTPCTHTHEPGCAVKAAVDREDISAERYNSYLGMLEEDTKFRQ